MAIEALCYYGVQGSSDDRHWILTVNTDWAKTDAISWKWLAILVWLLVARTFQNSLAFSVPSLVSSSRGAPGASSKFPSAFWYLSSWAFSASIVNPSSRTVMSAWPASDAEVRTLATRFGRIGKTVLDKPLQSGHRNSCRSTSKLALCRGLQEKNQVYFHQYGTTYREAFRPNTHSFDPNKFMGTAWILIYEPFFVKILSFDCHLVVFGTVLVLQVSILCNNI